MNLFRHIGYSVSLLALAAVAGCNQDSSGDAGFPAGGELLSFVADDTPYFFAALEPTPDDVREKLEPRMDKVLEAYRGILRQAVREKLLEKEIGDDSDEESLQQVTRVVDELIGMVSIEEMRKAGIGEDTRVAFYGVGLIPVLRLTLDDSEAFENKLLDIEERAGSDWRQEKLGDLSYRVAGDEEVSLVVAVVADHAVLSLMPGGLSEATLRAVFGLDKPARSMADSGRMQQLAKDYNLTPYGAGFIDFTKLVDTFLVEQEGANAELLALADFDSSQFSDVCKAEFREIAGIMPRLVTGYTVMSPERFESNTVLELREDIANGMATLTAPVPGLGRKHGGMLSLGMSIDVLAAREFYSARLDALEADPFECEQLAASSAMVEQGRAALQQPVPPMVYGVKGFLAVVEDIEGLDIATKQPPTSILMQFLLATDNAPGLVAMGSMFSPELATLNLQPDGKPVRFESPQLQPPVEDVHVAMTTSAIALSVGEGGEGKLTGMLEDDTAAPPPFFSMDMDAGRYYAFIGEATMVRESDDVTPDIGEQVNELMQSLSGLIDRVSIDVYFTDRGIEMPTVTTLAE